MDLDRFAVIMAGGAGSRLWPLSRESRPKQFIEVGDGKCMLLQTIDRIREIVPYDKCFIITNKKLFDITRKTVEDIIPVSNIILEPMRKNTAACIAYAAMILKEKAGQGVLCFIPADGYVGDENSYRAAVMQACRAAEETNNLVVIGITPTYPSTGYGYIHIASEKAENGAYKVERFVEKPDLATAERYMKSGDYLWNSGILVGTAEAILKNVKKYLPNHFDSLSRAVKAENNGQLPLAIENAYNMLENISFDNGVLEKCSAISAVKGRFDWDDIGSLGALPRVLGTDKDGNAIKGNYVGIDTSNTIICGNDMLVAAVGVNNMVIAVTQDAVLVCPKDRVQDVKALVGRLKEKGLERYL
ncbi:MAG: mannose-1-phosphate guanylyltransferase [[Clostridium] cellulosi]